MSSALRLLRPAIALTLLALPLPMRAGGAPAIGFPPAYSGTELLDEFSKDPQAGGVKAEIGAFVTASNNILPLRTLNNKSYPVADASSKTAYARLRYSWGFDTQVGAWLVSAGRGMCEEYAGNSDAAQLWLDLRSGRKTDNIYLPNASQMRFSAYWAGIGRRIPFKIRQITGRCEITTRWITSDNFIWRSAVGTVQDDSFGGMVKTEYSTTKQMRVPGRGWELNCLVAGQVKDQWRFVASIDGLAGKVSWRDIMVDDDYIVSPHVYEDPDGFLHNTFTASGAGWRQNLSVRPLRIGRVDIASMQGARLPLGGVTWEENSRVEPNFGMAWRVPGAYLPFVRCYPNQRRMEFGVSSRDWIICASTDDLNSNYPRQASLEAKGIIAF